MSRRELCIATLIPLRGLGAVIDGEAGFGFTLIEDATLPPLGFTDDELEALVLGLREVQLIGDPALSDAAAAALRKLQGRLPPRQSHRLSHAVLTATRFDRPALPGIEVAALRQATWDERAVEFAYTDAKGDGTRRRGQPAEHRLYGPRQRVAQLVPSAAGFSRLSFGPDAGNGRDG